MPFPSSQKMVVIRCLSVLLALPAASPSLLADEPPRARIAVIGDADSRNLSALVATELSARPEVVLVEREDLSRLGDEHKLEALVGSDLLSLGKLVDADGLLFLGKTPAGFTARFTAVGLGYALFDDALGAVGDPAQTAKALAHRVSGYSAKLKLDPAKAVPVSILNLRADYDTAPSAAFERNLTLLLENRLAAVPEYVVLERRHAWSLGFEHSLDPAAKPLLHGAYLIDGTLSVPAASSGESTVFLRVRPPDGAPTTASVRGNAGNLPALVDQLFAEIERAIGKPVAAPSSARQEAREYLLEGLWGWRAGAPRAAVEALDSAELLGANIADVEAIRIPVLYARVDQGMENWVPWFDDAKHTPVLDAAALTQKTDDALRAVRDAARYRTEKMESCVDPTLPWSQTEKFLFRKGETTARTIYRVSKLLFLLERADPPHADELRQALRELTKYDPLHGHPGLAASANVNNFVSRVLFADDWAQTLEEELAYYRLGCTDAEMTLPTSQMGWSSERFGARFIPAPADREREFVKFVESLRSDPARRLSCLLMATHFRDGAAADRAYRELLDELWKRREALASEKTNGVLVGNLHYFPSAVESRNAAVGLPLLHALLDSPKVTTWSRLVVKMLWWPEAFPESEAASLWTEFNAYQERLRAVWSAERQYDGSLNSELDQLVAAFKRKFPLVANGTALPQAPVAQPPDAHAPPLTVTRFWHAWLSPNRPPGDFIFTSAQADPDGGLWLAGYLNHGLQGQIFKIGLPGFETEIFDTPDGHVVSAIQCSKQAIYATLGRDVDTGRGFKRHLCRYDRSTQAWATQELPLLFQGQFSVLNERIYLTTAAAGTDFSHGETGLARYDWESGQTTILASNRRRPGRNQFDDTDAYQVYGVFAGPGDRPCFTTGKGTYYLREEAGEWPPVFDGTFGDRPCAVSGKTLVSNYSGEVTVIDPRASEPIPVMAPVEPFHRHGVALEPSPWKDRSLWDGPSGRGRLDQPGFHDGCLYLLVRTAEKGGAYELWCYRENKGRQPRRIPLKFQLDGVVAAALPSEPGHMPNGWSVEEIEHPALSVVPLQLTTTEQGLCLRFVSTGFWFLPYGDINAYLDAAPN